MATNLRSPTGSPGRQTAAVDLVGVAVMTGAPRELALAAPCGGARSSPGAPHREEGCRPANRGLALGLMTGIHRTRARRGDERRSAGRAGGERDLGPGGGHHRAGLASTAGAGADRWWLILPAP